MAMMVLTTVDEAAAPEAARNLLARSQQQSPPSTISRHNGYGLTIVVYKFTNLSRREIEAVLGVRLQETWVYQEAKAEGEQSAAASLVLRLLARKVGEISEDARSQISTLSLPQLEALGEALLDFSSPANLEAWLTEQER